MAIADYLEEIAELERPLGIAKLAQLSGLAGGDIETLREIWPTIPEERRSEVVEALVQLAEDDVDLNFDEAFRVCLNDEDSRIRVKAIDGLWESEDKSFIDAFIQLMRYDEEPDVRSAAAIALGRFALMAELDELKPTNAEKVKGALLEKANDDDESDEVRRRAVESLGFFSDDGVQDIVRRFYETGDERMKASAVCAMGHSCNPAWLPVLITELQNPDPEMRFEAAYACGELGEEETVSHLAALINDEDPLVQETAIVAIGQIGGGEARRALQRCMMHPDERVRLVAEEAIEELEFGEDPLNFTTRPGNNPHLS